MREHPHRQHLDQCIEVAKSPACEDVFVLLDEDDARLQLERRLGRQQVEQRALDGWTVAVKDLFDIAGQITTAGSRAFADPRLGRQPAAQDATAVQRLKHSGAIALGRANMTEFAYSGVGINPHCGTPINPCDTLTPRIPGGSSSGSAVAVATGAADIGLGTDTGGSLRIPAALCGIVGFKSTASAVPQEGCFPLSAALDTVGAMTRSVDNAIAVHQVLSARAVGVSDAPLSSYALGWAEGLMLENMDAQVSQAWDALRRLLQKHAPQAAAWDPGLLRQISDIQTPYSLVGTQAYQLHSEWLKQHSDLYDPRVARRMMMHSEVTPSQDAALQQARQGWIKDMGAAMQRFDVLLSPTTPIVAPAFQELAPGAERDEAFFKANSLLLRNTSTVNFLNGCAISIPCQLPGQLPVGLMIWHGAGRDDVVLNVARQIEKLLKQEHQ